MQLQSLSVSFFCVSLLSLVKSSEGHCRDGDGQSRGSCEALCDAAGYCEIRAALLLPRNIIVEASLQKVRPVIDLAIRDVREKGLFPPWLNFTLLPFDDRCDAPYALINAIDAYGLPNCIHVFFGPVCEFALASVARIVKFLGTTGTPLLTVGGLSFDFVNPKTTCDQEYHMLTRAGMVSFRDIAYFIIDVMKDLNWEKSLVINEPLARHEIAGKHTCHLMMKTLAEFIKKEPTFTYNTWDTERDIKNSSKQNYTESLSGVIGMNTIMETGDGGSFTLLTSEIQYVALAVCRVDTFRITELGIGNSSVKDCVSVQSRAGKYGMSWNLQPSSV